MLGTSLEKLAQAKLHGALAKRGGVLEGPAAERRDRERAPDVLSYVRKIVILWHQIEHQPVHPRFVAMDPHAAEHGCLNKLRCILFLFLLIEITRVSSTRPPRVPC